MKTKRDGRAADERARTARRQQPRGAERRRDADAPARKGARRPADAAPRRRPSGPKGSAPAREPRAHPGHQGPQTAPAQRPTRKPARPKNPTQAKARAKARKAKAPKIVRPPLRERLLNRLTARLATIDLRPRTLAAKVPFVVLVIGSLGVGLGVTLWLSTDAAERSYQLGAARDVNQALAQQKEALERDVLEAQAAPALAESARNLGMIPSRDTAHLVQDPAGNWIVVGTPKPAEGVPPPPLNVKLPDDTPAPAPLPGNPVERPVRLPGAPVPGGPSGPGAEVLVRTPPLGAVPAPGAVPLDAQHAPAGPVPDAAPGAPALGPLPGPLDAVAAIPAPAVAAPLPGPDLAPPMAPAPDAGPATAAAPAPAADVPAGVAR